MKCCGRKMKCRYSIPIGNHARYRAYKCGECGGTKDSFEVSTALLDSTEGFPLEAVKQAVGEARAKRFRWVRK